MDTTIQKYRPTESKYKGGATEMYVTYDLELKTRSGNTATILKVKRVYIAGEVKDWQIGMFKRRSAGKFTASQLNTNRPASATPVRRTAPNAASSQQFKQVVEIPEKALNAHFYANADKLPAQYKHALQNIK